MEFDVHYLIEQWPALLDGVLMTLRITALAILCSLLIGVLGFVLDALARGLHRRWVHG